MTVNEAKRKIHWHVRDSDSVRPEPYSSPAAARCAMQIRGEPMPGFWVKKIGLRGACPCRTESSVQRKSPTHRVLASGDCAARSAVAGDGQTEPRRETGTQFVPHPAQERRDASSTQVAADSVSSDRKVQTPRKEGEPNTKNTASATLGMKHAGAATLSTSVNPTSYDPSVAPATISTEAEPSQRSVRRELEREIGSLVTDNAATDASASKKPTASINSTGAGCAEAQPSQPRALLASAPTHSTYGQAELSYLNARSDGGMEG